MKLGELKSLGHNLADSVASGMGLLVGVYAMDVFGEAAASEPGFIEVNFLDASTAGSPISDTLQGAINSYRNALPELSKKHSIDPSQIKTLIARFSTDSVYGPHFTVIVESIDGRSSKDRYIGFPGRRRRCNGYGGLLEYAVQEFPAPSKRRLLFTIPTSFTTHRGRRPLCTGSTFCLATISTMLEYSPHAGVRNTIQSS